MKQVIYAVHRYHASRSGNKIHIVGNISAQDTENDRPYYQGRIIAYFNVFVFFFLRYVSSDIESSQEFTRIQPKSQSIDIKKEKAESSQVNNFLRKSEAKTTD